MEKIFDLWGKRDPEWETRYEDSVISIFADYGKGVNKYQEVKGKIFGAGYEVFIIAFFIGLYHNRTKPLVEDRAKRKRFGWSIEHWGNIESRMGRKPYPQIREYMFVALVAKTDIDWLALDKGDITPRSVVDKLIEKMEQYANFGFDVIQEKLEENPNAFYNELGFLKMFLPFFAPSNVEDNSNGELPDDLEEDLVPDAVQKAVDSAMAPILSSDAVLESRKERWYEDREKFEVSVYRKGPEFWAKHAQSLFEQEHINAADFDFLQNISRYLSQDRLISDKQITKIQHIVKSAEEAGYEFND